MSEYPIPEDLKPLCSKFIAPREVGGGGIDAVEFWQLIEGIARLSSENTRLREALGKIDLHAIHGCGTKQKDQRGRIFAAISDKARAALAEKGLI